jgi:TolB-like protein/tetratricopeptide (TPR) repeat protein
MSFIENFRQRKMVQWALAYLASAWLVIQLIDVLGSRWGVTSTMARIVDVVLVIGFLVTLVIAWYHGERGEQGVSGVELLIIAALLGVGGIGFSLMDFSAPEPTAATTVRSFVLPPREIDAAPWLAVVPFRAQGDEPQLADFVTGLTSDITTGLARFGHLLVISQGTTAAAASKTSDARDIGIELGARYVISGTARQSGGILRISVQLTDTRDGTTVWSERFDRSLNSASVFELQDEMTDLIVATIADVNGVVTRDLAASIQDKPPEQMTPYEAVLQFSLNRASVSAADNLRSRIALERAVDLEPGNAVAWACLAHVYLEEYMSVYNVRPNARDRALAAAQRAVELDPTDSLAQNVLALVQYFRQDLGAFRAARDRALELNPRDTQSMAMLGILTGYAGDWEQSVAMTTTAMRLNPNHPGWYRFNTFFNEYRQGNYPAALDIALRINMPDYWGDGLARALAYAQLGDKDGADAAVNDLLRVWPTFEADYVELGLKNWIFAQPTLVEHTIEGLEKAGLHMVR